MPDLRELYQELILEHSKAPRNYRELVEASRKAEGYNPLCGDHFTVFVRTAAGLIEDVSFLGSGCAISKASASMMTQALKGKTTHEAKELFQRFHQTVTGEKNRDSADLGKLSVFAGVAEFPMRVKCATLAWHTFEAALEGKQEPVSTE